MSLIWHSDPDYSPTLLSMVDQPAELCQSWADPLFLQKALEGAALPRAPALLTPLVILLLSLLTSSLLVSCLYRSSLPLHSAAFSIPTRSFRTGRGHFIDVGLNPHCGSIWTQAACVNAPMSCFAATVTIQFYSFHGAGGVWQTSVSGKYGPPLFLSGKYGPPLFPADR